MVHQIKCAFLVMMLVMLLPWAAAAQIVNQGTTGMVAPQLAGTGSPSGNYTCNTSTADVAYIQTDATNGRLWLCDYATGSWAWDHLINPMQAAVMSGTITGGTYILGGCTATTTVTVTGAVVGSNGAAAYPIFVSAPTGNIGLFNLTAWVSAANTVSVQGCAVGSVTVPNFTARVVLY